ncbi:hypothetical protein [Streptomyces sp. NPDC006193]|uniref:hypothetical protein n=1 Tax=Streptomyces sp. NPDC006193 TaxID=3155717 RepID=UPI0033B33698
MGEWTVDVLVSLGVLWAATGRWRDYPNSDGRTAEEVAVVAVRRSRTFNRFVLAVLVALLLTNIVVVVSY